MIVYLIILSLNNDYDHTKLHVDVCFFLCCVNKWSSIDYRNFKDYCKQIYLFILLRKSNYIFKIVYYYYYHLFILSTFNGSPKPREP